MIPELRRPWQEDREFEISLRYTVRTYLKNKDKQIHIAAYTIRLEKELRHEEYEGVKPFQMT